ncbi:MAG TPA: C13 family peptidase, partial [Sphingomonas sp.]
MKHWWMIAAASLASGSTPGIGAQAVEQPPAHVQPPPLLGTASPQEAATLADQGVTIERGRSPAALLEDHRRLERALAELGPQRAGVVDAYVVSVAFDSDPVFAREAREAARVLSRRYGAAGRTVVLAGADGRGGDPLAMGSPHSLAAVLARVAERMDAREDVLVLFTTSHGAPIGIVYNDGDEGYGAISPARLWTMLTQLGITNRLLLISACYSGAFVPVLASDTSAILTASAADKPSFGCQADNDWTFFGDALINQALRMPQPLATAAVQAQATIAGWERGAKLDPSLPQVSIGAGAARWLTAL